MIKLRGMESFKSVVICASCFFLFVMAGCSFLPKDYDTYTLVFGNNDTITQHISEDFPYQEYDYQDFLDTNAEEIRTYNSGRNFEAIKVESTVLENDKVRLVIDYSDDKSYYDFNNNVLFYGSVEKARKSGYDLTGLVRSVTDNTELTSSDWKAMSQEKVVILSEPANIVTAGDIKYVGDGVIVNGNKSATTEDENKRYLIF